ncbi:NLI interacting factor-like phosphatase family protein [Tritrichomonas foetus]|uniref:NLI interacting factor-like phosphatase family protein n=1 Tax=Tritrichomonas foetus TaxID=1144522 RepID=A0A1J4KBS4_9EUKA|nr:NLI interacting factor-like phosphatase family protein [Tritrichomonas foetus]|eukprot:OHT08360.1 NLI interacting factor-like phosphatase family protein [Tritrichomonas foetus]
MKKFSYRIRSQKFRRIFLMSLHQTSEPIIQNNDEHNDGNDDSDDSDEMSHVRGKHTLDPKVIHNLEMEILKTMAGTNPIDSLFSSNLPDSSINSNVMGSSLFNSSQSFSLESFTVDSVTTTSLTSTSSELETIQQESNRCCSRHAQIQNGSIHESKKPLSVGENKSVELLPSQSKEDKGKICLVLDLDETLIHSSFLAIPHADFRFILGIEQNPVGVFVCVRPGAERFLRELGTLYEIVIFTASCQIYADKVINTIDKSKVVKHRLYRESCTDFGGSYVKDLSRLNRNLEKIIIIDNSSVSYLLQPYNAISISSWYDDPTDNQLFVISDFLKKYYKENNIYDILVPHE